MNIWKYYDGDLKYPNLDKHSTSEIEIAKTNPKWAFEYTKTHGKNKNLESIIAKSAKYSYEYAIQILEDAFKLGEPAIAKTANYSIEYAFYVLKNKFKLGEPIIAKDQRYAKIYTKYVLKKDFYLDGKLICKYEG
jgi:hypothetical protein